ncbi:MAG: hypothetical protein Hyperionvirus5_52 [Hyperionvirus sp.]|uniref:Uncharacterized protein n=1 Tax=Hyperionvirus sp. TaxID=2487770 RepID=A0A3G5A7L3_9VIRU|nr:MAG: hypothetical protein Hyperionvirus5_52 [Hyperionvirus sp.]
MHWYGGAHEFNGDEASDVKGDGIYVKWLHVLLSGWLDGDDGMY